MYAIEAILIDSYSAESQLQSNEFSADAELNLNLVVGNSAFTNMSRYTAGASVGGQRVVMVDGGKAIHYDTSEENNSGKTLGITRNAAVADDNVDVIHSGRMQSIGWGLIANQIYYAGPNGTIITTIPSSGILQRIGVAIDPDTLFIHFSEPIVLI